MIRIHLYDPGLWAVIMPLVAAAAYKVFGPNVAFEEIDPMM
jgi:hypothetical protein